MLFIKKKSFDTITKLLLVFILAIPSGFMIFYTINKNIRLFNRQSHAIYELELLYKDFKYFTTQKGLLHNYDIINKKMENFQNSLQNLKLLFKKNFENKDYVARLDKISNDFLLQEQFIEHIKSNNSIIVNTFDYLYDLNKNIKKYSKIDDNDLNLLRNTLYLSMQTYTNDAQILDKVYSSLDKIKLLSKKDDDKYIRFFYQHEVLLLKTIASMHKESKKVDNLNIYRQLKSMDSDLLKDFSDYLDISQNLMFGLVLFLVGLLITILYLHRGLIKRKNDLNAYKYAIENSDNSIVITDLNKNIIYVNEAFEKETGYSKEEVIGKNPRVLKANLLNPSHYVSLNEALRTFQKWEGEFINKRKDGSIYYEKASISPMFVNGKITGYIAIKLNITKYIEQQRKIKFLAFHDRLTSLPNRHFFEEYFNRKILSQKQEVALLYIDLDHFKNINDTLGHQAGDELLKIFIKRLKNRLSKDDLIARLGGDEFVVIVHTSNREEVVKVSMRILDALKKPIVIQSHKLNITTSIGVAFFPSDGKNLEELLKYADMAMYKAKSQGRNGVQLFSQNISNEISERMMIEQELRKALEHEEFYMVYQPKYNIKTKDVIGFEALIRWENEKLGFVPPDKFISIAEETGLIDDIGYFVFAQACKDFQTLKAINTNIKHMAINVSTVQLQQKSFIQDINKIIKKFNLKSSDIEIEMTETYIMKNIEKNIQTLESLKKYGYKIAIDDFGTGYSSFAYLKQLPISTLKIDKSFVDDICVDNKDKQIIETIVALAEHLGFDTVAEGIETREQKLLLEKMGCKIGQGYFFSKPLKIEDLVEYIWHEEKEEVCV